jgi:hypothetical protein
MNGKQDRVNCALWAQKVLGAAGMAVLLIGTGCNRQEKVAPAAPPVHHPQLKPSPPTPIQEKREELGGPQWQVSWDKVVEEALPREMLSPRAGRKVHAFCPRFDDVSNADKRAFWAYVFQALAAAEAGLKPTTNVRHTEPQVAVKDTVTGEIVHQEGLLQLTYQDSKRYGCDFAWQADRRLPPHDPARTILNPKNNLECGVRIMDNQLFSLHRPLVTPASYWSTLRPGTESYRVWIRQMANVPTACGFGVTRRKRAPHSAVEATRKRAAE